MKRINHPSSPDFSPEAEPNRPLNDEQIEFLDQISNGLSTAHAGDLRGWTEDTARNYQSALFKPLDARTAAHAVRRGFELHLLKPGEGEIPPVRELVTREESEVLLFASLGYVSSQIAQMQDRPLRRVYQDRRQLYRKYGADNMPHAVRLAIERGDIKVTEHSKE